VKFLIAVVIALFGAASAHAADLPARTYTEAPAHADPGYDWTGFYIGANVGYSWARSSDTSTLNNGAGAVLLSSADSSTLNGVSKPTFRERTKVAAAHSPATSEFARRRPYGWEDFVGAGGLLPGPP
jgi:opacity protein-like surface antigen